MPTGRRSSALDREGIDLAVEAAGADPRRARPVPRAGRRRPAAAAARRRAGPHGPATSSGQDELTLIEREVAELAAIRTFVTSVVRTETITRGIRQITFGGGDLATFRPISADQFLYVLAPPAGRTRADDRRHVHVGAVRRHAGRASSRSAPTTPCAGGGPTATSSTCCSCSTASTPTATTTAPPVRRRAGPRRAAPGDPVALWGPRSAYAPPAGTDRYLLVADDTGLPGVAAIIDVAARRHADRRRRRGRLGGGPPAAARAARRHRHVVLPPRRGAGHDHRARRRGAGAGLAGRHAVRLGRRREQGDHRRAAPPARRARAPPGRRVDDRLLAPRRPLIPSSASRRSTVLGRSRRHGRRTGPEPCEAAPDEHVRRPAGRARRAGRRAGPSVGLADLPGLR